MVCDGVMFPESCHIPNHIQCYMTLSGYRSSSRHIVKVCFDCDRLEGAFCPNITLYVLALINVQCRGDLRFDEHTS